MRESSYIFVVGFQELPTIKHQQNMKSDKSHWWVQSAEYAILDKIVRNEIVGTTNKQNVLWYYEFSLLYLGHAYSHPLQLRVEHTCK